MSIAGTDKPDKMYKGLTKKYVSTESEKESETENAIVVKEVRKSFKQLTVLDGVNFVVKKGTVLALLGPNGAGIDRCDKYV
jgi:ABC-type polysaccharide/polyol phosphate transport system ATPase subunit